MKVFKILLLASLGFAATAFADRGTGGGGNYHDHWPTEHTVFDNKYARKMGFKKELWLGECQSKDGVWPNPSKEHPKEKHLMALGVFSLYHVPYGSSDQIHLTKFYLAPNEITKKYLSNDIYCTISNSEEKKRLSAATELMWWMRESYKSQLGSELEDNDGKATLKADGSWQWNEEKQYFNSYATFTLKSFNSWNSDNAPILYLSAKHHVGNNDKKLKDQEMTDYQCIFTQRHGPIKLWDEQ